MGIIAKGKKMEFEKVAIDEFINGLIVDVQERKGIKKDYKDNDTGETKTRTIDQVRFIFQLEGYEHNHYSRWNNLSTNERSNLYLKYIVPLFGGKYPPDSSLDVEKLKGLKVKVRWDETPIKGTNDMFQFVDKIRLTDSNDAKTIDLLVEDEPEITEKDMEKALEEPKEEEIPF